MLNFLTHVNQEEVDKNEMHIWGLCYSKVLRTVVAFYGHLRFNLKLIKSY